MNTLTYRQAYDKIIEAYFKDQIQPLDPSFCFCGTLNKNDSKYWIMFDIKRDGIYYSGYELQKMEDALLQKMGSQIGISPYEERAVDWGLCSSYEDALFAGMSAALEVLRQIHIERGENVDEDIPAFTKRELTKTDIQVVNN